MTMRCGGKKLNTTKLFMGYMEYKILAPKLFFLNSSYYYKQENYVNSLTICYTH